MEQLIQFAKEFLGLVAKIIFSVIVFTLFLGKIKGETKLLCVGDQLPVGAYNLDGTWEAGNELLHALIGAPTGGLSFLKQNQTFGIPGTYIFDLQLLEAPDGEALSGIDTFIVAEPVPISLDSASVCRGDSVLLQVPEGYRCDWDADIEDGNCNLVAGIGTYTVTLMDSHGCITTATATVTDAHCESQEPPKGSIYVPNTFSPNDDGINDVFTFYGPAKLVAFQVYDRWGNRMLDNGEESSWDGRFRGKECDPGVYLYDLWLDVYGKLERYRGGVTLVR